MTGGVTICRTENFIKLALRGLLVFSSRAWSQGIAQGPPPPANAQSIKCKGRNIPQLTDVGKKSGIRFSHTSSPDSRFIAESISRGVLLLDYDRDGWLDIYFTNMPTVDIALKGEKAKGAQYHNNHDGSFTDVTDEAGVGTPCWAMGDCGFRQRRMAGDEQNEERWRYAVAGQAEVKRAA